MVKTVDLLLILSDKDFAALYAKKLASGDSVISAKEYGKLKSDKKTAVDLFLTSNKLDGKKVIVETPTHQKNVSMQRAKDLGCEKEYIEAKKYVDILIAKLGGKAALVCFTIVLINGHGIVQFFIR